MIAEAPRAALLGAEGPTIFQELRQIGSGDYQYYRQPNGWIAFGQIGKQRSYENNFMRTGWKPLGGPHAAVMGTNDYGVFDLDEYYLEHPHEILFIRGGARELPLDQILAHGYHLRPPLIPRCGLQVGAEHKAASGGDNGSRLHLAVCWRGAQRVQFPQLAGRNFADPGACPFCHRDDFASALARNQHIGVMHKTEMGQMTLADAIVKGVQAAQGAAGAPATTVIDREAAEAAEAARMAVEQAEIEEKIRAMFPDTAEGVIDDGVNDGLLAASEADGGDDEPAAPKRASRKK